MSSLVFVGQAGVDIRVQFVTPEDDIINVSSATTKQIRFLKPTGVESDIAADFVATGSDGWIKYVTPSGFLDIPGVWDYWGYAVLPGDVVLVTESGSFEVEQSTGNLTESILNQIDASWGGAGANSYVSLEDANTMVGTSVLTNAAWLSATAQDKVVALIEATIAIDALSFVGGRYYPNLQVLEWPRSFIHSWPYSLTIGTNLNTVEQTRMLSAVQRATVYQAIWILQQNTTQFQEHALNQAMGVRTYKEVTGPLEDTWSYGNTGGSLRGSSNYSPMVFKLLNKWITGPRVVRK